MNMREVSAAYEQLFNNLAAQMYIDMSETDTIPEAVDLCNQQAEEALGVFQEQFPDEHPVACEKGCSHCCSFPIECPPQVIIDIATHIKESFTQEEKETLLQKLLKDVEERKAPLFRFRCVFLDDAGTCTIYEKRPTTCRSFSSYDSLVCQHSVTDGRIVNQDPLRYRIYQCITSVLIADAKDSGKFDQQVPFAPSLLKALQANEGDELWPGYYTVHS